MRVGATIVIGPKGARRRPAIYRDVSDPAAWRETCEKAKALQDRGWTLSEIRIELRLHPMTARRMLGVRPLHPGGGAYPNPSSINCDRDQRRWEEAAAGIGPHAFENVPTADCGKPPLPATQMIRLAP